MFYLGYVNFANEGTKRIRDEMLANELPAPIFEQKNVAGGHSVRVTLRNDYKRREPWIDSEVSRVLGDALPQRKLSVLAKAKPKSTNEGR